MTAGDGAGFNHPGTRRQRPPAETLAWLQPRLAEFGITRVANITGLDRIGVPVATAVRPTSRTLAVSQGKGLGLTEAKVSAIMESIEMLCAERPALPLIMASRSDLAHAGRTVLDMDRMPLVGEPIDPGLPLLWLEGRDLTSGASTCVPYACVALDDTVGAMPTPPSIPSNSNGLASGNTTIEATVHALCEVIERDAATLWRLSPPARRADTAVDLATVDDPLGRQLLDRFAAAGLEVRLFEITSDVGIPAYEAMICEADRDRTREPFAAAGAGCHPWRGIALTRALTEAAQCRLTLIAGAREDLLSDDYAPGGARAAGLADYLEMGASSSRTFRRAGDLDPLAHLSFEGTLGRLLDALAAVGASQVVAVDLTLARFGIPVVKVLVPGLEGVAHEAGFRPGSRARRAARLGRP